jgi:hypothetical protein
MIVGVVTFFNMGTFLALLLVVTLVYILSIGVRAIWREWKLPYDGAMRFVFSINLTLVLIIVSARTMDTFSTTGDS